jgi:hypothetical protein
MEMNNNKIQIPITLRYLLAFLLLTFLCYEAHEIVHHLVGGLLCGGFGTMTFTTYVPKPECRLDAVVTLSGPLFSFALAWLGAFWLVKRKHMLFAYTLVFASFAHLRFPLPLMGSGDEWLVVRTNFEQPNATIVAGILFLLALPPLVTAYRSIANRWRVPVFAASWILPFVILGSITSLDVWLLGAESNSNQPALIGVPLVIWGVNLLAALLILFIGNRMFHQPEQVNH